MSLYDSHVVFICWVFSGQVMLTIKTRTRDLLGQVLSQRTYNLFYFLVAGCVCAIYHKVESDYLMIAYVTTTFDIVLVTYSRPVAKSDILL